MKRHLALASTALALLWLAPAPADADPWKVRVRGHSVIVVVAPDSCPNDGHTGAPSGGTILYAARRATWGAPPTCLVPDVDYAVGPDNACVACVNPETASLPAGWSWNAPFHRLDCDGAADNSSVDGLDFTKVSGGSGGILISNCKGVHLSNIKITSNCSDAANQPFPIRQLSGASNAGIYITKVSIDRGGLNGYSCGIGESIYLDGPGVQSVTYSRFVNVDQHSISFICQVGDTCTSVWKWNSESAVGFGQGQHTNGVQWLGAFASSDVSYNYYYNPQPSVALEAANTLTIDTTSGSVAATLHQIVGVTQTSYIGGMSITSANLQSGTTFSPADTANPGAVTLSKTATATASGVSAAIPNAYPFGMTTVINYDKQSSSEQSLNATFIGNVFDGDGPIQGGTYAIKCTGYLTAEQNGVTVTGNYYNTPNYSGGFLQTNAYCTNLTVSGNKSLVNGATVP
jgi:hypothetical protein